MYGLCFADTACVIAVAYLDCQKKEPVPSKVRCILLTFIHLMWFFAYEFIGFRLEIYGRIYECLEAISAEKGPTNLPTPRSLGVLRAAKHRKNKRQKEGTRASVPYICKSIADKAEIHNQHQEDGSQEL